MGKSRSYGSIPQYLILLLVWMYNIETRYNILCSTGIMVACIIIHCIYTYLLLGL